MRRFSSGTTSEPYCEREGGEQREGETEGGDERRRSVGWQGAARAGGPGRAAGASAGPAAAPSLPAPACLLRVCDRRRAQAVEGHERHAAALGARQLGRQAQRRLVVLHLKERRGRTRGAVMWKARRGRRRRRQQAAAAQRVQHAQRAQHAQQLTTTWKSDWLATTSVQVYSSLRQSNSSIRVPCTCGYSWEAGWQRVRQGEVREARGGEGARSRAACQVTASMA